MTVPAKHRRDTTVSAQSVNSKNQSQYFLSLEKQVFTGNNIFAKLPTASSQLFLAVFGIYYYLRPNIAA